MCTFPLQLPYTRAPLLPAMFSMWITKITQSSSYSINNIIAKLSLAKNEYMQNKKPSPTKGHFCEEQTLLPIKIINGLISLSTMMFALPCKISLLCNKYTHSFHLIYKVTTWTEPLVGIFVWTVCRRFPQFIILGRTRGKHLKIKRNYCSKEKMRVEKLSTLDTPGSMLGTRGGNRKSGTLYPDKHVEHCPNRQKRQWKLISIDIYWTIYVGITMSWLHLRPI